MLSLYPDRLSLSFLTTQGESWHQLGRSLWSLCESQPRENTGEADTDHKHPGWWSSSNAIVYSSGGA